MSRPTLHERFDAKVYPEPNTGCWLWGGATGADGYGTIISGGRIQRAHRVSWELHCGPIEPGMVVCHSCDTPACVNPEHLRVGTQRSNLQEMDSRGRRNFVARGERLTREQAQEIRESSLSQRTLAKRYGVSQTLVCHIKSGKRWAA